MAVLLIEDDETIGEAVRNHLCAFGFEVDWSRTLAGADLAAAAEADAIILDLQLPDGNGFDFLKALRAGGAVTPVIVVSSQSDVRMRLDCLRSGADDYLAKPFHLRELALRIRRLAGGERPRIIPAEACAAPALSCPGLPEPVPQRPGPWTRMRDFLKARRAVLSLPLIVVGAMGCYFGYLQASGNFHTVIAGELYRSAQPSVSELESYVAAKGIRTVVNLRGPSNQDWYKKEVETAQKLGLRHIDFGMSAQEELTSDRADEIVALLKDAPKPILIHCRAGSDRTGLISVLYSARIAGIAEVTAEKQLSFYYGHVGLPYVSKAFAMDESWEKLERYYGLNHPLGLAVGDPAPHDREKT